MIPRMHIRRAHASEAPALSDLARASKAHWPYSAEQLASWHDELTLEPSTFATYHVFVAEVQARIVGFYLLVPLAPHWQLEHLWIVPDHIGQGIGRKLLRHAATLAEQAGAKAIAIDADPHAESFYLACGARRVGALAAPIQGSPNRVLPQLLFDTESGTFRIERPGS